MIEIRMPISDTRVFVSRQILLEVDRDVSGWDCRISPEAQLVREMLLIRGQVILQGCPGRILIVNAHALRGRRGLVYEDGNAESCLLN